MATLKYLTPRSTTGLLRLADSDRVAAALRGGGLAILPTETGYMVAALATDTAAILRAFQAKGRDPANTMHVACSSMAMAAAVSEVTPMAARIIGELTPGPVTVVIRQTSRLPSTLVTANGTVGIRVPDHPATLQVIDAVGAPVTATSLNHAGEPPSSLDRGELERLDWPCGDTVYVVVDDTSIVHTLPSTLVRLTGPTPEILRAGPITESAITAVLRGLTGCPHGGDQAAFPVYQR